MMGVEAHLEAVLRALSRGNSHLTHYCVHAMPAVR